MKTVEIRCGSKKSARTALTLKVERPETLDECRNLTADKSDTAIVAAFNRALDIARIDRCGRPMFEDGKTEAEIQAKVSAYKFGSRGERQARQPITVAIPKGKKAFSPEEVAALLAAKGITATVEK